jgi:hypothetical protein
MKSSLVIEDTAQAEHALSYSYLPFEMPKNLVRLELTYETREGIQRRGAIL